MLEFLYSLDVLENQQLVKDIYSAILKAYQNGAWKNTYIKIENSSDISDFINYIISNDTKPEVIRPLTSVYNLVFLVFEGNPYKHVRARFYDIDLTDKINKRCCFVGSWEVAPKETLQFAINAFEEKYNIKFTDYYLMDGENEMINLTDNNTQITNNTQDAEARREKLILHLMNPDEKRKYLEKGILDRDYQKALSLPMLPDGTRMTMAQYNFMKTQGLGENTKKKKILFTESQIKHIIKENMCDELANYPQSFNMDIFKSLNSYNKKIKYCNQNLQRLASGSSRIVYKIDDATVLKLAKNNKGLAQNETEATMSNDYYAPDVFAKVYDVDDDYKWIEMQLARKAKPSDFKRLTGYKWEVYQYFIEYIASNYVYVRSRYNSSNPYEQLFKSEEFQEFAWNNSDSLFYRLSEYLSNYQIEGYKDIERISSWGVVQNQDGEELVIVDYGLDNDTLNNFYRHK
jgi:mRNA-degrading endonuclease RelE of RelBE toxin-antitoxin system